ncbi:hypothetical protein HPG69_008130 [Diceros bicornis minor]|uniref:Uncharacterized protein n=1 Tax=Diceros bicornis minor TaxID=77932 RepID=A0A7J7F749_DICBM|nr:hypothetical protein HPG69_008130 [Diceros bicornis minor]
MARSPEGSVISGKSLQCSSLNGAHWTTWVLVSVYTVWDTSVVFIHMDRALLPIFGSPRRAGPLPSDAASLALSLMVALRLLGQQHGLDVGQDAALSDGHAAQQLVELLVVADSQLQVTRDDARLLVVARRVARQLQNLSRQVLEHRRQIDRRASSHALRIVAFPEQPMHAAHGELKAGAGRARLSFGARLAALLTTARHLPPKHGKTKQPPEVGEQALSDWMTTVTNQKRKPASPNLHVPSPVMTLSYDVQIQLFGTQAFTLERLTIMPDPSKSAPAPKKGSKKAVTKAQKKDGKKRKRSRKESYSIYVYKVHETMRLLRPWVSSRRYGGGPWRCIPAETRHLHCRAMNIFGKMFTWLDSAMAGCLKPKRGENAAPCAWEPDLRSRTCCRKL